MKICLAVAVPLPTYSTGAWKRPAANQCIPKHFSSQRWIVPTLRCLETMTTQLLGTITTGLEECLMVWSFYTHWTAVVRRMLVVRR